VIIAFMEAAACFAFPLLWAFLMACAGLVPRTRRAFLIDWAACGMFGLAGGSLSAVYHGQWYCPLSSGASGLLALFLLWWTGPKRKKAFKLLGEKGRAALAAMVKNMPKPGPVLRPVPQGA
jgi:hypothetical protein